MPPSGHGCCSRQDIRTFDDDRFCLSCGSALPRVSSRTTTPHHQSPAQQTGSEIRHYQHTPLTSASEFRVLKLLPGEPSEELHCEIIHADISAAPQYEALSYTWGSQRLTGSISIHGNQFRITENCRCALHNLRKRTKARMLWIDAICINQVDNQEKNHQIPLINRIYFQAERTLVYLGNENRTKITQLFDFLRRRDASGNKAPHPAELTEEQRIQFQGELSWVLSLAWFTRVWVLQEMAVCRRSVVMLGAETLDWRALSFGNIYSLGLNPVNMEKDFPRALQLPHNDRKPIKDLASLLAIARSCSSTDKRDRIYALLGIFKNKENISISVDYNKPVEELYTEVGWQVIKAYGHLELLSEAGTRIENDASLKLEEAIKLKKKMVEISLHGAPNAKRFDDKLLHEWAVKILERQSPSDACKARCTAMLDAVSSLQAEVDRKSTATSFEDNATLQDLAQSVMEQVQLFQESLSPFVPTEFHGICENPRFRGIPLAGLPSWVPDYSRHPYLHSLASWNSKVARLVKNELVVHIPTSKSPRLRVSILEVDHIKAADAQGITKHDAARFLLRKQHSSRGRILRPYWVPVRWPPIRPEDSDRDANVPGIQTHDRDRFWETFEPELESSGHGANIDALRRFSTGRIIVLTKDSFAITPQGIRPGDVIGFIRGASVPFLLRPAASEVGLPAYTLAGECYLHGTKGPKIAKDYMDLLGIFKHSFKCTDQQDLPWKEAYLAEDRPGCRPARQPPVGTNSPNADAIFAAIDKPPSRPLQQQPAKPMLLARRITTNPLTTASRRLSTTTTHKNPRPSMLAGFPTAAPAAPSKPLRYADVAVTPTAAEFTGVYRGKQQHPADFDPCVLDRAAAAGVRKVMLTGMHLADVGPNLALCAARPAQCSLTMGVHPYHAAEPWTGGADGGRPNGEEVGGEGGWEGNAYLAQLASHVRDALALGPRSPLSAFGELGLDWDKLGHVSKELQLRTFRAQLALFAREGWDLPLFLHCRAAFADFVRELTPYIDKLPRRGLVHSFVGSRAEMEALVGMGFDVSVNGFSFATRESLEMVAAIPLERLQIETDAPWGEIKPGAEVAKRYCVHAPPLPQGKKKDKWDPACMVKERNESCAISRVAFVVAGLKGIAVEEVAETAWRNSVEMFRLERGS